MVCSLHGVRRITCFDLQRGVKCITLGLVVLLEVH